MKVIIAFQLTANCACFLDRTGSPLNQKWGLLFCHCLPVKMVKCLTYDWTPLLRLSNWTELYKPPAAGGVHQYAALVLERSNTPVCSLSHNPTPPCRLLVFLCAEIWFALYVTAGMSSCYVSMLLLQWGQCSSKRKEMQNNWGNWVNLSDYTGVIEPDCKKYWQIKTCGSLNP